MALLLRRPYIIMQYLVDKAAMRVELRTPQRHMPAITQWHRMRHHLRNRPSVYPKATRSFPLANFGFTRWVTRNAFVMMGVLH